LQPKRRIITDGVLSAIVLRQVAPASTVMGGHRWSDWRGLCFVLSDKLLGTLYEGLLEYRLNLVDQEPMVMRENKGNRIYIPLSQAGAVKRTETILEVGLKTYVMYYNQARPHQGIQQRIPDPPALSAPPPNQPKQVVSIPVLGGLHDNYQRAA
jgi:hypothetical protein